MFYILSIDKLWTVFDETYYSGSLLTVIQIVKSDLTAGPYNHHFVSYYPLRTKGWNSMKFGLHLF